MVKGATRIPRELPPWYPEWTINANCTPGNSGLSIDQLDEMFFEAGKRTRLIRKAKAICGTCPVIKECFRQNREVPQGIFFGMTALERWRFNGNKGYPHRSAAYSYFAHWYGRYWNGPQKDVRKANGQLLKGE